MTRGGLRSLADLVVSQEVRLLLHRILAELDLHLELFVLLHQILADAKHFFKFGFIYASDFLTASLRVL